jgi:hypothetical protein
MLEEGQLRLVLWRKIIQLYYIKYTLILLNFPFIYFIFTYLIYFFIYSNGDNTYLSNGIFSFPSTLRTKRSREPMPEEFRYYLELADCSCYSSMHVNLVRYLQWKHLESP